jgi:hypothetical protein
VSQDTSTDNYKAEAARRLAGALDASMIDALLADAKTTGTPIDGVDGLLNQMTKAVIERALQAEMTHELGYTRDDPPAPARATPAMAAAPLGERGVAGAGDGGFLHTGGDAFRSRG